MATRTGSRQAAETDAPEADKRESEVARAIEEYRNAYQARDVDRMLALFANDAELTVAPGTFRGKDEIRKLLEWDVRLSPGVSVRDTGVGVVVSGRAGVSERVVSLTFDGIPYEEQAATVYELDDVGKIRRLRSYCDKLALMDQIASSYPGIKGWIFKKLTGYVVGQGRKGLDTRSG
jgi:ketosteroid isomerase-like protein